jgi:ATP-binding cassette subfamily C (CFTR/MRP) protein 4
VYANRDIILLDDPLSAVDARVGRHIFEKCICGLLKDKICILVTHQVQFLPMMSHILLLGAGGVVSGYGSFDELVQQGHALADELKDPGNEAIDTDSAAQRPKELRRTEYSLKGRNSSDGKLVAAERKAQGKISGSIYRDYWLASGGWMAIALVAFFMIGSQALLNISDWALARWVQLDPSERNSDSAIGLYGGLVGAFVIVAVIRAFVFFHRLVKSSQTLHDRMFRAVIATNMLFFDTNPVGRILNRFSRDLGVVDDQLPELFFEFTQV